MNRNNNNYAQGPRDHYYQGNENFDTPESGGRNQTNVPKKYPSNYNRPYRGKRDTGGFNSNPK